MAHHFLGSSLAVFRGTEMRKASSFACSLALGTYSNFPGLHSGGGGLELN